MFLSKNLLRRVAGACFLCTPVSCWAATAEDLPPAPAFFVSTPTSRQSPEVTPYLLYQTNIAWQQDQRRLARWAQVKTEDELLILRKELRTSVLEMIGGLPAEKTGLHATITGRVAGDSFHIEKLVYQSLPGLYVTALVYVPENGSRVHPAILVTAGHSQNGKLHYQELCQRLVKRGYLVISWDPVGQGERSQFWDAKAEKSRYNLICAEHAVMGNLAYLAGTSLARWEVWDGMRAVDYLLSRSDVDAQRISITGTSGGGFQAALIGALDERIKVIIPSCYITALPMRIANRIFVDPDSDPEQDLFGFVSKGVDHAGLLLMMYPRPVMVAAATLDFFPIQGTHKSFSEVSAFYERFGHGDRVQLAESYNDHQYSLKNQEAALSFLDRFNGIPPQHGLPPVTAFSDADLRVTRSGQISVDYPDAQPLLHYIAEYSAEARHSGQATLAQLYRKEQATEIASWSIDRYTGSAPAHGVRWEPVGTAIAGTVHLDRYVLHHNTYLQMPLLHFHTSLPSTKGPVLWMSIHGKATQKEWPQIKALLDQGYEVFSFDFRGLGETRMNYRAVSPDDPDLVQGDFDQAYISPLSSVLANYVYNSLLTGRPYLLQMMDDVEVASLFVRCLDSRSQEIAIATSDDSYDLAVQFQKIDRRLKLISPQPAHPLNWSTLVTQGQEQWPIIFLMPSGALIP